MVNPLVLKLHGYTRLSAEDEAVIERLAGDRRRSIRSRRDLVGEGEVPQAIMVVEAGWAGRYRMLEDGRRQIVALLLPGDLCDLNIFVLGRVDHAIQALTPLTVAFLSPAGFDELMSSHVRIRQALWWDQLVAQAIQREWAVNLGQRSAFERLAHLFCELYYRLRLVGLVEEDRCPFPLTQTDIGEMAGLSTVHVNRTLQELRTAGLIVLKDRTLWIPRLGALEAAAMFDAGYLHLDRDGRHLDAN